jgi:hypothetical protein
VPARHEQIAAGLETIAALVRGRDDVEKVRCESRDAHALTADIWLADPTFPAPMTEPRRLAVWLATGELFARNEHGAMGDDPVTAAEALDADRHVHAADDHD